MVVVRFVMTGYPQLSSISRWDFPVHKNHPYDPPLMETSICSPEMVTPVISSFPYDDPPTPQTSLREKTRFPLLGNATVDVEKHPETSNRKTGQNGLVKIIG